MQAVHCQFFPKGGVCHQLFYIVYITRKVFIGNDDAVVSGFDDVVQRQVGIHYNRNDTALLCFDQCHRKPFEGGGHHENGGLLVIGLRISEAFERNSL